MLAIDFDVQNALRLHLGVPLNDGRGFVARAEEQAVEPVDPHHRREYLRIAL
nr:cellulose synthase operon protein YhjQ [Candidatus Pantoea persica]